MGWLIFSFIVTVGLFVVLGVRYDGRKTTWKASGRNALCLLGLLLIIPAFIAVVPANSVGIIYSPFSGTKQETLSEGWHTKGFIDKIYTISTEVQTMQVSGLTTQTKDAQYVTSILDIKYRVNKTEAFKVFTEYRTLDKMSNSLIVPTAQRVLELITTKYNIMDVLGEKRPEVYKEFEIALKEEFALYGVDFYAISITDMDAGDAIEQAITAEAVAKKAVETAEQELLKAQTQAKQKSVVAQAEQEAAKIEAETKLIKAEADKKANELLQQSLTDELLIKQWIEKWSGNPPTYYGGSGADLLFNMGNLEEK